MDYESQSGGDGSHPPIDPQSTGSNPGEGRVDPMTSGQPGGFGDQPGGYNAPPGAFGGQPGGGQPGSFGSEPGEHLPHGAGGSGYHPPPEGRAPGTGYTPQGEGHAPGTGYTPPAAGHGPDHGQQYGYQPPSYSSTPKKGGFNWLACCGIGCGISLLLGIAVGVIVYKYAKPFVGMIGEAVEVGEDIKKTDLATIQANAEAVDSATLMAGPEAYKDKWLAVSGELDDPEKAEGMGSREGTTYVTTDMLVITDVSDAPRVAQQGAWVTAYGKIVVLDLTAIPGLKKAMEEEAAKNPDQPIPAKIVLLMAKQVVAEGATGDGGTEEAPAEEAPADDAPAEEATAEAEGGADSGG